MRRSTISHERYRTHRMGTTKIACAADTSGFKRCVWSVRSAVNSAAVDAVGGGADDDDAQHCRVGTCAHALHPLTGARVPLLVAKYVLADVGSGAVMVVPAHSVPDLKLALERLDTGFAFVGLTEAWARSICLFHLLCLHPELLCNF